MTKPILVRSLTDDERQQLKAGLRSSDAFVLRRCQIVLASARGEWAPRIARNLGCDPQMVRNVTAAFNEAGLACLRRGSSLPHTMYPAFGPVQVGKLRALLHQSPRNFGRPTSLWTLELAAEVCFKQGITATRVTGETIRATLARLGIRWLRAKQWITSPDPHYGREKGRAIA